MASVLVTGGAGFIGAHVSEALLRQGHKVCVLDDLSGGFEENVPSGATFVKGSILDSVLLKNLFEKHAFQYVFHLAAYAAEGLSHFIKRFNYENNLIGSVNLINLSVLHQVKCFVFTSSIAVYGKNQLPMREDLIPQPEDPYGIAKYAVEQDLKVSHEMFGLNYIIFRPHNVYGEKQNIGDKYRNVVGIFMNQIMQGLPMTIFGDGTQKRAFSYIDDVAPVIARSIEEPKAYNQVFNIGADQPYTVNFLAEEVAKAFNVKPNIKHLEQRNEVQEAYSDHEKAREVLGAKPQVSLAAGLKRMAGWAQKNGARKSQEFKDIEVSIKLPPSWKPA
jgi:UDP-glucose 4-epimerase